MSGLLKLPSFSVLMGSLLSNMRRVYGRIRSYLNRHFAQGRRVEQASAPNDSGVRDDGATNGKHSCALGVLCNS